MEQVDKLPAKRYAPGANSPARPYGAGRARPEDGRFALWLAGGAGGESQLNHALLIASGAQCPFSSGAAAFDNAVKDLQPIVTPVTMVDDVPTTFQLICRITPDNFGQSSTAR
jgi:hypothetical protein